MQTIKESLNNLGNALTQIEEAQKRKLNIFRAVGMRRHELRHSAFLAWLLDPCEAHELKNAPLRKFCERLFSYETTFNDTHGTLLSNRVILEKSGIRSVEDINKFLNGEITVSTERVIINKESRLDIFIEATAARTLMVIENKTDSSVHDDQLIKYKKELENSEYADYKKLLVFLSPDGKLPTNDDGSYNENWCVCDYKQLKSIAAELLGKLIKTKQNPKTAILLEDYIELISTDILNENPELQKLCKKIIREHKDALDVLWNYSRNFDEIAEFCKKHLPKDAHIIVAGKNFDFYRRRKKFFRKARRIDFRQKRQTQMPLCFFLQRRNNYGNMS